MPFSFSPGQEQQQGGAVSAPATQTTQNVPAMNNGVPTLVVPTIPNIAVGGAAAIEEKLSPFAFRNRNKSKFGVYFQFVVFAIFGFVLVTAIGLFIYQRILISQVDTKMTELAGVQANFPALPLDEMVKFSTRLKLVNQIMKDHTSVRTAFKILEKSIENPVTYTKFSLSKTKDKKGYNLNLDAEASSYKSAYQQTEILKSKTYASYINKVQFSNISLDTKKGMANFRMDILLYPEGILPDSLTFGESTTTNSSTQTSNGVEAPSTPVVPITP